VAYLNELMDEIEAYSTSWNCVFLGE